MASAEPSQACSEQDHVTVRLVGGLGNQLFGYYAGYALAARLGVQLRCDIRGTREGMTDHGIEILRFELPAEWLRQSAILALLAPRRTRRGNFLRKIVGLRKEPRCTPKVFQAQGWGYDPRLMDAAPGAILEGYFQSWRHVADAVAHGAPRRPCLRSESGWLKDLRNKAQVLDVVAVQVRRGDYVHLENFGLLGPAYYARALEHVGADPRRHTVWLFSDDPDNARKCIPRGYNVECVESPAGAAETLVAMSLARRLVIANSTFGWWAAWMSGPEAVVGTPSPRFKAEAEIRDLDPPEWHKIESAWL